MREDDRELCLLGKRKGIIMKSTLHTRSVCLLQWGRGGKNRTAGSMKWTILSCGMFQDPLNSG